MASVRLLVAALCAAAASSAQVITTQLTPAGEAIASETVARTDFQTTPEFQLTLDFRLDEAGEGGTIVAFLSSGSPQLRDPVVEIVGDGREVRVVQDHSGSATAFCELRGQLPLGRWLTLTVDTKLSGAASTLEAKVVGNGYFDNCFATGLQDIGGDGRAVVVAADDLEGQVRDVIYSAIPTVGPPTAAPSDPPTTLTNPPTPLPTRAPTTANPTAAPTPLSTLGPTQGDEIDEGLWTIVAISVGGFVGGCVLCIFVLFVYSTCNHWKRRQRRLSEPVVMVARQVGPVTPRRPSAPPPPPVDESKELEPKPSPQAADAAAQAAPAAARRPSFLNFLRFAMGTGDEAPPPRSPMERVEEQPSEVQTESNAV